MKIGHSAIKCDLCSRTSPSIYAANVQGWDWFTGSLDRTYHYCQEHATSQERDMAFEKSRLTTTAKHRTATLPKRREG